MRTNRLWIISLAIAFCLAGCNQAEKTASNSPETSTSANSPVSASSSTSSTSGAATSSDTPNPNPSQSLAPTSPNAANQNNRKDASGNWKTLKNPDLKKKIEQAENEDKKARARAIQVPPKGTASWAPTQISPSYIAEHMDESIAGLKNVSADVSAVIVEPGGSGRANLRVRVKNPKTYKIQFFEFGAQPVVCQVVSNGKDKMMQVGSKWSPKLSSDSTLHLPTPDLPKDAVAVNFSPLAFQPLFKTDETWASLVKRWMSPNSGFKVTSEFRSMPVGPAHVDQVRIYVERTPEAAKKLGNYTAEVIVDCMHSFPVTIISNWTQPNGKKWGIEWSASYNATKSFEADAFEAPFGATKAIAGRSRKV